VERASKTAAPAQRKNGNSGNSGNGGVNGLLRKILGEGAPRETAQQTIPYDQMYRDGICRINGGYNRTLVFGDLNYQLADTEEQTAIFEDHCDFLNTFDSSVYAQMIIKVGKINVREGQGFIRVADADDAYNSVRGEFASFLNEQYTKGRNGLQMMKFLTFGIETDNLATAKQRLGRIESDLIMNYKKMGVHAFSLNGQERLAVLHDCFHPDGEGKFVFSWSDISKGGMSTKDFVAPSSFEFEEKDTYKTGRTWGAVSFINVSAAELSEQMLYDLLNLGFPITVTLHLRSIDQAKAIKKVKSTLSDLDKMKIEEEKRAFKGGYFAALPPDLKSSSDDAESMLKDLQQRNERLFMATVLVNITAPTRKELENCIFAARGVTQTYNCDLKRLDYRQEHGLMGSVPLGTAELDVKRALTTSQTAVFLPYTTQEIFMGGEALYYGLNALSNNLIMANRKDLSAPNGAILGTPGSGKSFAAKMEMTNVFLTTQDDIIISDPEAEYFPLVKRLGGEVIKLSVTSAHHINPLDMQPEELDGENPIALKSDFILSLFSLIMGGRDGLSAQEKTIIDRCVPIIYREYLADPTPDKMPTLSDLYKLLLKQSETDTTAKEIATALEIYVTGSLNQFNHRTNVDISNRVVCFDIKDLGGNLKEIGMLILQDQVWQRVTANRAAKRTTWFYQDEFHLLLREKQTAAYCVEIWKRFRKWGGIPTAITQNVKDFLESPQVENIIENSNFFLLLNQAAGDREILGKKLGISSRQLSHVTQSAPGEGLVIYGGSSAPFVNRFPRDTEMYRLMTTRPSEVSTNTPNKTERE
jgi:hypothetical protein